MSGPSENGAERVEPVLKLEVADGRGMVEVFERYPGQLDGMGYDAYAAIVRTLNPTSPTAKKNAEK